MLFGLRRGKRGAPGARARFPRLSLVARELPLLIEAKRGGRQIAAVMQRNSCDFFVWVCALAVTPADGIYFYVYPLFFSLLRPLDCLNERKAPRATRLFASRGCYLSRGGLAC